MLPAVFYLFLAGCPEHAGACEALPADTEAFVTKDACEAMLFDRLSGSAPAWPVMHGICVPGETGVAATPPAAWPRKTPILVASARP